MLKEASLVTWPWYETEGNVHKLNPLDAGFTSSPLNFPHKWRAAVVQIIQKSLQLGFVMPLIFLQNQVFLSNYIWLKLTLKWVWSLTSPTAWWGETSQMCVCVCILGILSIILKDSGSYLNLSFQPVVTLCKFVLQVLAYICGLCSQWQLNFWSVCGVFGLFDLSSVAGTPLVPTDAA